MFSERQNTFHFYLTKDDFSRNVSLTFVLIQKDLGDTLPQKSNKLG